MSMRTETIAAGWPRISRRGMAWSLAVLTGILWSLSGQSFAQEKPKTPKEKTLYHRIGGYDVIAGITDDFLEQLGKDEAFKRFGGGRSAGSLKRARQLIVDQICALAEGPCVYFGREMKPSHEGLAITQAEWDSSVAKLKISLNKFKVAEPEQVDFLALIDKLQKDIVEPPAGSPAVRPH